MTEVEPDDLSPLFKGEPLWVSVYYPGGFHTCKELPITVYLGKLTESGKFACDQNTPRADITFGHLCVLPLATLKLVLANVEDRQVGYAKLMKALGR